ncbi:MAG: DNA mismatch repair protein MutS [Crocinitomicaceae bacterium]|nr:DNA mismatch repair protein MutS [Crocinitomicaceae bacterium]
MKLIQLGFARLVAFLLVLVPFFFLDWPTALNIAWAIFFLIVFLILVSRYTDIRLKKNRSDLRISICEKELDGLIGDFSAFGNGLKFNNPQHPYSYDMDLFGDRSFFQSLNRTGTLESEALLASILTSNSTDGILEKQKVIQELVTKPEWCLEFRTHLAMQEEKVDQTKITESMSKHTRLLPSFGSVLAISFSVISISLLGLVIADVVSWQVLMFPFFAGLLISGLFVQKVSKISLKSSSLALNFRHLAASLKLIESENWISENLAEEINSTSGNQIQNSALLVEFSKILSSLDQRNNIFFALFANGFFLWDLRHGTRAEKWILKNAEKIDSIFTLVNSVDAQISFATYAYTHESYSYPLISLDSAILIEAVEISHPLLKTEKRVSNNLIINRENFFVITGANMAGKSTFLRTIGISVMMANCGLPVCAKSFRYAPVKLISSMRSSDSLVNDESYFFAELKRLKFIVDQLDSENYLIILDEILKGTNSKDKEEGSKKFLQRLLRTGSSGLIATHDLSLCDLATGNVSIKNFYFDAEIVNDELHFDYIFKNGICQNMNASFLLRKMKIVD